MAEFITALNDLFGGFKQRAARSEGAPLAEVAFVLVTSPSPMSIQEVLYFSEPPRASRRCRAARSS
jgi:hypothetical protein